MAIRSPRPSAVVHALVVAALAVPALAAAAQADTGLADSQANDLACTATALAEPVRLSTALEDALEAGVDTRDKAGDEAGVTAATVRAQNDLTSDELAHLAEDRTSWLDECGQVFVVDRAVPQGQQVASDEAPADAARADVFGLSSRPSSTRTIYLDFDGATSSGTRWNNGARIVSPAYSIDADLSTFNDTELAQIYLAWKVVAEDFAPFDVNVTTRAPDPSALTRTSASDQTYGTPVVVTPTNSVGSGCGCGGAAYVGTFGTVGANDYQPAWIFTSGSGTGGDGMGQAISHEVGHTFGLSHDGTSETGYYSGDKGWAPIMGSSYSRRASHWSSGEYPDANNTEDDVAIISRIAPTLADDHPNSAVGGTSLEPGTPLAGVITTRTDVDAFSFVAHAFTSLTVAGPSGYSDVDVQITIFDALGMRVATIDPTADSASDASLDATWSVELPLTPTTYTAVVDGTGSGSPGVTGGYSDFGSIGTYSVSLATGGPSPMLTPVTPPPTSTATSILPTSTSAASMRFVTTKLPRARVGKSYRAVIAFTGPVAEARVGWRLPKGLKWRVLNDRIVVTGKVRRSTVSMFTTMLSGVGPSVRHRYRLVVR